MAIPWTLAGNIMGPSGSNFYDVTGLTQLVPGQGYIEVVFPEPQLSPTWTFVACRIVNTADPDALNIWPGIVRTKTKSGFRVHLSGLPDTLNYYLYWTIRPPSEIGSGPATTYLMTGAASGVIDTPASFVVQLIAGQIVEGVVTIMPDDGGAGGTFTPVSVQLTTNSPAAAFTYTPATYTAAAISATNDSGLNDPAPLNFLAVADRYLLSGPTAGFFSEPSPPFTVQLPAGGTISSPVTITPTDQPDASPPAGAFTPFFVTLSNAAPAATFLYTAPGVAATRTIRATNNGGLINPAGVAYVATFNPASVAGLLGWWKADSLFALADGDPVSVWPDSSANGRNATQSGGARPVFKTNILNGQPTVLFRNTGVRQFMTLATQIDTSGAVPLWTAFVVMKLFGSQGTGSDLMALGAAGGIYGDNSCEISAYNGWVTFNAQGSARTFGADQSPAWHVFTTHNAVAGPKMYIDGISRTLNVGTIVSTNNFGLIGTTPGQIYLSDGYIAEILIYNSILSDANRGAVETYLKAKYGLS
jgi:hypothetical protein